MHNQTYTPHKLTHRQQLIKMLVRCENQFWSCMLIRHDFSPEMPPKAYMTLVADQVTKSYMFLWDSKNENFRVNLSWDEIRTQFSKTSFISSLRKLCNEGLLSYISSNDGVTAELVGWQHDDLD